MNEHKLSKKEQAENIFITLGRLGRRIKDDGDPRTLALFEKVTAKVSQMDLDLPMEKREAF